MQDEKWITNVFAGCVFEELKASCPDHWTPGPQKRSVMTERRIWKKLLMDLKKKTLTGSLLNIGMTVKPSLPQTSHCCGWTLKALTGPDHSSCKEMARGSN